MNPRCLVVAAVLFAAFTPKTHALITTIDRSVTDADTLVFDIDLTVNVGNGGVGDQYLFSDTVLWHLIVKDNFPTSSRLIDVDVKNDHADLTGGSEFIHSFSFRYDASGLIVSSPDFTTYPEDYEPFVSATFEPSADRRSVRITYNSVPEGGPGLAALVAIGAMLARSKVRRSKV